MSATATAPQPTTGWTLTAEYHDGRHYRAIVKSGDRVINARFATEADRRSAIEANTWTWKDES